MSSNELLVSPQGSDAARARTQDPHHGLHSQTGALPAEHPGRSRNPLVKIAGLAWLEFEKPDLARAERFLTDFGFLVTDRTPQALVLRGTWAGTPGLVIRRGVRARFVGSTFAADAHTDLDRLAHATDARIIPHRGGHAVDRQLTSPHPADRVDEASARPRGSPPRRTTWFPSTSRSIRVSRNVRTASSGVITIGSFSLNDVFSRIGTPVSRPNSRIRR